MNIATILLVYVIIWWLVFFPVLTYGMKAQNETDEGVTEGTVPSAPANFNLKKKMLVASVIALVLTTAYYFLATSGLIDFRHWYQK